MLKANNEDKSFKFQLQFRINFGGKVKFTREHSKM